MTSLQDTGLSVHVFSSLASGGNPLDDISSERLSAYGHEKAAVGGYLSATITLNSNQEEIEDWFVNGIGRHLIVYNEYMSIIWEGFVNKIDANLGPLSLQLGPLMDTSNRVSVVYQTKSYDPLGITIGGGRAVTDVADMTRAQARYGVLEMVLTGDTSTEVEAERYRDTFLEESHEPESNLVLAFGRGASPSLTLNCLGYVHYLDRYYYTEVTPAGIVVPLSDKIQSVLVASPNNFFSTNYARITENLFDVSEYEADEKSAWVIIKDLVAFGDSSDNRYIIQLVTGRQLVYEPIPTVAVYQTRLNSPDIRIERIDDQSPVRPWNVEAGQLIFVSDFLTSSPSPLPDSHVDPRHGDPRYIFIESIQFNTPNDFSLNGGKVSRLPQLLARQGLGGS